MKRRIIRAASMIAVLFLCACGMKDAVHNEKETTTPLPTITHAVESTSVLTATPKVTPTPTEEQLAQKYINALDRIDWTELEGDVNEEDSIRNSNLLNHGYVTYDNQGKIYYVNREDGKIYTCGYKGENKQLVCEESNIFGWLQLKGAWLYYSDMNHGIHRVHLENGKIEQITQNPSGVYFFDGDKIYFEDRETGFGIMDLEGNNREQLLDSRGYLNVFVMGDGYFVGDVYGDSMKIWNKHYLAKFSEEKIEIFNQRANYPLLAGKYFSVVTDETQTRHIWNLETKQEIDLKAHTAQAVVSDGHEFYYWSKLKEGDNFFYDRTDTYCTISRWDGTSAEEIIKIDGALQLYHMFLTPDMMYYQPDFYIDGKQVTQLWYYDRKTGETGQIY